MICFRNAVGILCKGGFQWLFCMSISSIFTRISGQSWKHSKKKFVVLEAKHGFPSKRRYTMLSGADEYNTLIIAYEWESLGALETGYAKLFADPDYLKLVPEANLIIKDQRIELYQSLA